MTTRSLRMLCAAALAAIVLVATPALGQQKTAKQCNDEWKANKTELQASGTKKQDFIAQCRGTAATATPAPSPSPSAAAPPPAGRPPASGTTTAPGQFQSEAQAKAHCPGDTVVWANLSSRIYHFSGTRDYGNTKHGAYMCEGDTAAAGVRAAKNEKHP